MKKTKITQWVKADIKRLHYTIVQNTVFFISTAF
ncbi:hypothetical protein PDESU_03586 [Pontiella desulfatans]|uniref:Uncharacterized protein n=1 Tax=Pontiella desulfatans TaxID=2750659 RepID=A0A6C2U6J0_PONDE|nr:hypothetical protein PDESU_03586 [Pontiella desulfatans]